ncbi:uncharacterized protein LOC120696224 [Panicum virgatum]|uniref:Phorbol-ester/DAG-type domain-containing protein n=1 Tax=Panicum virgatum TaxID=38727 RepID=A0A8T0WL38_PANVG|nr:uncharacterized protein LOC120696224 [Panicum virgatum]KAG2646747.1 hypothetical protein PVAP13_2KG529000 [Panicum virgatum]
MAGAGATTTIRSSLFHAQHPLNQYHYAEGSAYRCDACELRITGIGFRCGECDFDIHAACLGLPVSISLAKHSREHDLTLTRLKASRWCDVCKETSHAGCYMYLCAPCNYDVHPRWWRWVVVTRRHTRHDLMTISKKNKGTVRS